MRRTSARISWDAESDQRSEREHNSLASPRSPLAGDHLLGGDSNSRSTHWNNSDDHDDDRFGDSQTGAVGAAGGSIGDGTLKISGGIDTRPKSPTAAGGVVSASVALGSGDGSQLLDHSGRGKAGASAAHNHGHHHHKGGGGGSGSGGGSVGRKRHEVGGGGRGRQRRFFLRIHKFVFQKELAMHFSMCMLSIAIPFSLSGSPWLAAIPLSVWCFYNAMFVVGAKRAGAVLPGFDRFKRSFVMAMQEFLPPRLVPVLSLSFLSVLIAVTLTAARLGGPPLCFSSCSTCLASWKHAHPVLVPPQPLKHGASGSPRSGAPPKIHGVLSEGGGVGAGGGDSHMRAPWYAQQEWGTGTEGRRGWAWAAGATRSLRAKKGIACGYANGKELLALYTVSQSAILIYLAVMTGLLTCLAWQVSGEELEQRQSAENRLKSQNPRAFELRERMILEHGRPGSSVRPETTIPWLMFGLVAAFTFTLIGWRKWGDLPPTIVSAVVVGANVTTTLASVLMLHVGFHGRLIALYQGNLHRVQFLSKLLREGISKSEEPWVHAAEGWWFLRSFVLGQDLSLDYDVGGLGVSATFFIVLASFVVAVAQILREGLDALINPPGSYCAYASVYLTVCLIRIFGLATKTYLEQQQHIGIIQEYSDNLASLLIVSTAVNKPPEHVDDKSAQSGTATTSGNRSPRSALSLSRAAISGTKGGGNRGGDRDVLVGGGVAADEGGGAGSGGVLPPAQEAMRRMISHMKESDPYPCVLGIPVKPALFATSKVYVFVCFAIISTKLMYDLISTL